MYIIKVSILVVSDRCSTGVTRDESGANLKSVLDRGEVMSAAVQELVVVPDDIHQIQTSAVRLCDGCDLLLTVGGTGFSPRDVTPEAVAPLLDRRAPGLVAAMLHGSLVMTSLAALSRPVAGVRGACAVVTLPGSVRAAEQCMRLLAPALPHAVDLLRHRHEAVERTHRQLQVASGSPYHHVVDAASRCSSHMSGQSSKVDMAKVTERPRQSSYPAISMEQAQDIVMEQVCLDIDTVTLSILESQGHVLATAARAAVSLPPFPASVKDGYAVQSADGAGVRRVMGAHNAGDATNSSCLVVSGCCVRVSTGAPVPTGTDAVVMVEHTRLLESSDDGTRELSVEILTAPRPGQDIRPVGSDFEAGALVADSGSLIGPFELAALAAAGVKQVTTYRRPRVAVMSTGGELSEPGSDPLPDRVYDSNRCTLMALVGQTGCDVTDAGVAPDDATALLAAMQSALTSCDVLVTTGGVSMGERDLIKRVLLDDLAADIHFGRVFMKPGLPTTFASLQFGGKRRFVFGLPGNPVSAAVCCVLHVLPALRRMRGLARSQCVRRRRVRLSDAVRLDSRPEYVRAFTTESSQPDRVPCAVLTAGDQRSSNVLSLVGATVLLQLPARSEHRQQLDAGDEVDAVLLQGY